MIAYQSKSRPKNEEVHRTTKVEKLDNIVKELIDF